MLFTPNVMWRFNLQHSAFIAIYFCLYCGASHNYGDNYPSAGGEFDAKSAKERHGIVSGYYSVYSMMAGALGMTLVTLSPEALIENVGIIQFSIGIIGCLLWLLVKNKPHVTENIITLK